FFTACSLMARRVRESPRRFACSFANCSTTELLWNVVCNDALAFCCLSFVRSSCQRDFSKDLHLKCTMEAKNYMLYLFSSFFKTLEQITAKTNIQYYKKLVNGKTKNLFSFLPKVKRSFKLTMI